MYEAGPQVLSPVRKPNQVDTVTWDVTREFLHPLASFRILSTYPLPGLFSRFPAPILVAKRLPMSIPRGPLFELSGRCIREQRDDFPTDLSSLSSFAFEKIDKPRRENNTVKVSFHALVDCSPLGRTRLRKEVHSGNGKSKRR